MSLHDFCEIPKNTHAKMKKGIKNSNNERFTADTLSVNANFFYY